jgi:hypothetical protein
MTTAFVHEEGALGTTKGIDDLTHQMQVLKPRAVCMPEAARVIDLVDVFVAFFRHNPQRSTQPYEAVLQDAVEAAFCS